MLPLRWSGRRSIASCPLRLSGYALGRPYVRALMRLGFCSGVLGFWAVGWKPGTRSSKPSRPHLAVAFVRDQMRRCHPRKAGVQDRLFDLPQQAEL